MITADLILPCLYHLQRQGRIGEITVCALSSGPLRALAENGEIRCGFPRQLVHRAARPGHASREEVRRSCSRS